MSRIKTSSSCALLAGGAWAVERQPEAARAVVFCGDVAERVVLFRYRGNCLWGYNWEKITGFFLWIAT